MQILVLVWHGNVNEEMVVIISFYILSFLRSLANSISLSHFASVIFIWNDNYLQSTIIRLLNIMINHSKATKHFARIKFENMFVNNHDSKHVQVFTKLSHIFIRNIKICCTKFISIYTSSIYEIGKNWQLHHISMTVQSHCVPSSALFGSN